jgi:hypothetical protein
VATVHMPLDAGLAELLRSPGASGGHIQLGRILGDMSNAASPRDQRTHVEIPVSMVRVVFDALERLLGRAREAGDPAAEVLDGVLVKEFGAREISRP